MILLAARVCSAEVNFNLDGASIETDGIIYIEAPPGRYPTIHVSGVSGTGFGDNGILDWFGKNGYSIFTPIRLHPGYDDEDLFGALFRNYGLHASLAFDFIGGWDGFLQFTEVSPEMVTGTITGIRSPFDPRGPIVGSGVFSGRPQMLGYLIARMRSNFRFLSDGTLELTVDFNESVDPSTINFTNLKAQAITGEEEVPYFVELSETKTSAVYRVRLPNRGQITVISLQPNAVRRSSGNQPWDYFQSVELIRIPAQPIIRPGSLLGRQNVEYTEQAPLISIDPDITITDQDSAMLFHATASISSGFLPGDRLYIANQNGIKNSYDPILGILRLTGQATLEDYQTALQSIAFSSSSDNPTDYGAELHRTISFIANDGFADGPAANVTLDILAVNDPPVVTAGGTATYFEGGPPVLVCPTLTVTDPDNTNYISVGVTILGPFGEWSNGDILSNGIALFHRTMEEAQVFLRTVTFSSTNLNPGNFGLNATRTVSFWVSDGVDTSVLATSVVRIVAANDPPVITAGNTVSYNEHSSTVKISPDLTVADPDNLDLVGATVTISGGAFIDDELTFESQNGIGGSYDVGSHTLTLSGVSSVENYQSLLRACAFKSNHGEGPDPGFSGTRTISFFVDDGQSRSRPATATILVSRLNGSGDGGEGDPIGGGFRFGGIGNTIDYIEQAPAIIISSNLTISAADGTMLLGATVTISDGAVPGDELGFTDQNRIVGTYNPDVGILTLNGLANLSDYQNALRSVSFLSTSDNPTAEGRSLPARKSRIVTFMVSDGVNSSASAPTTINIIPLADAPQATDATTDEDTRTTSGLNIFPGSGDGGVTHFKVTSITGGILYQNDGTTVIQDGDFITVGEGFAGLKFFPGTNLNSPSGSSFSFVAQAALDNHGIGLSPGTVVWITVIPVSDAPVAGPDFLQRAPADDLKVKVSTLLANDTDADSDVLTVTSVTSPSDGGAVVTLNGDWIYYTRNTARGDTFTYTVSDGNGGVASTTVTINEGLQSGVPALRTSFASVYAGDVLQIPIAELTGSGGFDQISSVVTATQQHGNLALETAFVTYTPPPGYLGADIASYLLSNGQGGTIPGEIHLQVKPKSGASPMSSSVAGRTATFRFIGIPRREYYIQRSTDLNNWDGVAAKTAGPNGIFEFSSDGLVGSQFYRAVLP